MLSSNLFKIKFKIDEKFNGKGIQNNSPWNHIQKIENNLENRK